MKTKMSKKDKLTIFGDRLKKIGIDVTFACNYPWIYLNTINGKTVVEIGNGGNHGYVIAIDGMRGLRLTDNMSSVFKLIKRYNQNKDE